MIKIIIAISSYCIFSIVFCIQVMTLSLSLHNKVIGKKLLWSNDNPYIETPQNIGFNKEIVFTSQGSRDQHENLWSSKN